MQQILEFIVPPLTFSNAINFIIFNLSDVHLALHCRYFNHCNSELYYMMQLNSTLVKRAEEFINKSKLAYVQELSTVSDAIGGSKIPNCPDSFALTYKIFKT